MNDSELISIIVPVYNVSKYLGKCIDSILNQTYTNLEIILVDDGSTDDSGAICDYYEKFDNRIKVIHKQNGGLSGARNTGIKIASGTYIGFIDSDDYIKNDMYEKLIELIESGSYDISVCDFERLQETENPSTPSTKPELIKTYTQNDFLLNLLKAGNEDSNQYAWNKLYKRDLFFKNESSKCNIISEYPEGLTCEDVEGTFRIVCNAERIIKTDYIGYYYRITPNSITQSRFNRKNLDYLTICDHVVEISKEYGNEKIINSAYLFRKRADFTLLCTYAVLKTADGFDCSNVIRECLANLRKNYKELKGSSMSLSRKIVLFCMKVNFPLTAKLLRIAFRLTGKTL